MISTDKLYCVGLANYKGERYTAQLRKDDTIRFISEAKFTLSIQGVRPSCYQKSLQWLEALGVRTRPRPLDTENSGARSGGTIFNGSSPNRVGDFVTSQLAFGLLLGHSGE
ncbi:MAG: hypothetical protein L0387_14220 [Acidobacteria bacterium]|nr:hypothetical protein [Acidobacteriota bacterium]MCI0721862.1 hypothetical protein [Acidobacteriota bacterium]